jgi:hypothetical protein
LGQPYSERAVSETPLNKAKFVFYKKGVGVVSTWAEGIQASITLDQRERGHIFEGGYLIKYVEPGPHTLDAEVSQDVGDVFATDLSVPEIHLIAKAGDTYYFRHIIHAQPVSNSVYFVPIGSSLMMSESQSQRARRAEFLPIAPDIAEKEIARLLEIKSVYRRDGTHYQPWQPITGDLTPLSTTH